MIYHESAILESARETYRSSLLRLSPNEESSGSLIDEKMRESFLVKIKKNRVVAGVFLSNVIKERDIQEMIGVRQKIGHVNKNLESFLVGAVFCVENKEERVYFVELLRGLFSFGIKHRVPHFWLVTDKVTYSRLCLRFEISGETVVACAKGKRLFVKICLGGSVLDYLKRIIEIEKKFSGYKLSA